MFSTTLSVRHARWPLSRCAQHVLGCGLWMLDSFLLMAAVGNRRAFFAIIIAEISLLLRSSDDDSIAMHLLAMGMPSLLASASFASSSAAMCWLNNPVSTEAVHTSQLLSLPEPTPAALVDGGWLAVVTRGSSSCFQVDRTGVSDVLHLLKNSLSPVCVVVRLASAADAYSWLVSAAVKDLLDLWCSTVEAHLEAPFPRLTAPPRLPPPTSAHASLKPAPMISLLSLATTAHQDERSNGQKPPVTCQG